MLLILLTWTYILLLSFLYGHFTLSLFRKAFSKEDTATPHFSLVVILGFVTLTSLASLAYMVVPLGIGANVALLAIGTGYAYLKRNQITRDIAMYRQLIFPEIKLPFFKFQIPGRLILWGLMGLSFLVALIYAAIPSHYYDEGLYYLQFMKWINEYAIVPGLGNLHPRLAFNSNWHLLSALFSFSFLKIGTFNDLNGLMHVLVAAYGITGLSNLFHGYFRVSNAFRALLILPTHLFLGYLMAPSADTAVIYLVWLVLILFIEKIETGELKKFDINTVLILFFGVYVCTVKLSAFPIALLPGYLIVVELMKGNPKRFAAILALCAFIVLPWMTRNVVLSGYAFYPFYQINLFAVDWKVPVDLVQEEVSYIEAFAAGESMVRTMAYPKINEMSMGEWFSVWYGDLRTSNKGIFFLVLLLSAGYFAYFVWRAFLRKDGFIQKQSGYLLLFTCMLAGLAFWFFKAPDFRFGYAFTVGLYLLSFALIGNLLLHTERFRVLAIWGLIGLVGLFYLKPVKDVVTKYKCLATNGGGVYALLPGNPIPVVEETYTTPKGLVLYKASCNDQCWGTTLPCTPFPDIGVELRNPAKGLQAGFKIEKANIARYRELQIGYQPLFGKEPRPVRCNSLCE